MSAAPPAAAGRRLARRRWLALAGLLTAVVLALGGLVLWPRGPAPVLARAAAAEPARLGFEQLDLTAGWRFRTDPTDAGRAAGWATPAHADASWGWLDMGDCWENLGYPGYDGVAWYRRLVVPPASWRGQPVYLWLSGADDELDLFVDGQLVAHYPDAARAGLVPSSGGPVRLPTRLEEHLRFGEPSLIALRADDRGPRGGVCDRPVVLSTSAEPPLSGAEYLGALARRSPAGVWPGWARGRDTAWSIAGLPQGPTAAVVGLDGATSPSPGAFSLTWWVYDPATRRLLAPEELTVEQRLLDGYLPAPVSTWQADGLRGESGVLVAETQPRPGRRQQLLRSLGLAASAPAEPVALYRAALTNAGSEPRRLVLVVALRPYGPNAAPRWVGSVEGAGDVVRVDGRLALVAARPPASFGATSLAGRDLGELVRAGAFPAASSAADPQGLATIGLEYPLTLAPGETQALTFALPMRADAAAGEPARIARLRELRYDEEAARFREVWQGRLRRVTLDLPDKSYTEAFGASLGYILTNMRGRVVTSGPFAHNAMWYRDTAYVVSALLKSGLAEVVPPILAALAAGQMPSGEFPAALEVDGRPRFPERHEWDAQGQFIYAVAEDYRLTGDRARLAALYPSVARAARFAVALSEGTRVPARRGTPYYGLLPAGDSAEDLGPREWHHYWDDFWAIGGLREAAYLARALGREDDAREFEREGAELRRLVLESIAMVGRWEGIDYVPNGPEDVRSSSMARGTTPAVWPLQLFPRDDPLIVRSFDRYHERWVRPYDDAYLHNSGNYWVYGGLELAHSYMYLWDAGRAAWMVIWAMANQTAPGTYAWAEAAKPESRRFAGGDMPHTWAAAEYVLYLRDALVREAPAEPGAPEGRLILADGVPAPWLQPGLRVGIHGAPTYFGSAGYTLTSRADEGYWELEVDEGTRAPGGYLLRGPFLGRPTRLLVDGRDVAPSGQQALELPAETRRARVYFGR